MKNRREYGILSIMFGIIILLCILLFRQCSATYNNKSKLNISNQNIAALKDTIRVQKNRAGELTYSIKTLLTDKKNLEILNKDLREELEFSLDWKYDSIFSPDNYRKLSGNSFFYVDTINNKIIPGKTRINDDEIGFSLVTGLREKNGSLEIFVTPKYPGMKITKIEGAVVDPKKSDLLKDMFPDKRISVGPYIGIGLGAMYHSGGKTAFGPVLNFGFGLQYSLFKF